MWGAEVAKGFVRKCLSKRPGSRPCATEALGNKFITRSLVELNWLYEDMVLKSWVRRGEYEVNPSEVGSGRQGQVEGLTSETGEVMEDLSQMALGELDMNCLEGKERKRHAVEVDECDLESEGMNTRRKKRKIVA